MLQVARIPDKPCYKKARFLQKTRFYFNQASALCHTRYHGTNLSPNTSDTSDVRSDGPSSASAGSSSIRTRTPPARPRALADRTRPHARMPPAAPLLHAAEHCVPTCRPHLLTARAHAAAQHQGPHATRTPARPRALADRTPPHARMPPAAPLLHAAAAWFPHAARTCYTHANRTRTCSRRSSSTIRARTPPARPHAPADRTPPHARMPPAAPLLHAADAASSTPPACGRCTLLRGSRMPPAPAIHLLTARTHAAAGAAAASGQGLDASQEGTHAASSPPSCMTLLHNARPPPPHTRLPPFHPPESIGLEVSCPSPTLTLTLYI